MKKEIKEIFERNKQIIGLLDKVTYYIRVQNYDRALRMSGMFLYSLSELLDKLMIKINYFDPDNEGFLMDSMQTMMLTFSKVQEDKDWILLADLYETQMMGHLLSIQERIIYTEEFVYEEERLLENIKYISENDSNLAETLEYSKAPMELLEQGYVVEYTAGGDFTLGIEKDGINRYFHSNNRVGMESLFLANSWYREEKEEYVVYGLGLGYHVRALYEIDEDATVEVYESDINIIKLACAFTNLGELINRPNFKLIYDPRLIRLKEKLGKQDEKVEFVIHYPSIGNIAKEDMKEKLEDYFLQYSSLKNQISRMNGNFRYNVRHQHQVVDDLKESFQGKDLYIVAAGPSLDSNYMQLKEVSEQGIIMATGTVFRKLMTAGIKPNYVIVTDSSPRVYHQVSGLEGSGVPMIYLSTAYKGFAKDYKGIKYIVYQRGYDLAEKEADKQKCQLYHTGGSVSTTALDVGIQLQCRRIIFLGLDLSYPNQLVHALGTSLRELKDTTGLRQVDDISGNKVHTNKAMDMYRKWIERHIAAVDGTEIIDATEGGVVIKGMRNVKLAEVIR